MMTTYTDDINFEKTSLNDIFIALHTKYGGVYCFEVIRDSDFLFTQYLENELMVFDQILPLWLAFIS